MYLQGRRREMDWSDVADGSRLGVMILQKLPLVLLTLASVAAAPSAPPGSPATPAGTQPASGAASPAEAFKSLKAPAIDRQRLQDPSYRAEVQKEVMAYNAKRAEMAEKLLDADPNAKDATTWFAAVVMNDRSS